MSGLSICRLDRESPGVCDLRWATTGSSHGEHTFLTVGLVAHFCLYLTIHVVQASGERRLRCWSIVQVGKHNDVVVG